MTRLRLATSLFARLVWALWEDRRICHHYDLIDHGP